MNFWLILTPLLTALLGWFLTWFFIKMLFRPYLPQKWFGFSVQGIIPKRQPELSARIGKLFNEELITFKQIEDKILDASTLQKITPEIEMHIDYFLRVKLKDAMPMVAMFVGDKTIIQLKEVFMTEMKVLFPDIMKSYVKELQKDLNIGEKITLKLTALPAMKIEAFVLQKLKKEWCYVQIAGTLLGFIIGAFQVIIILLILS